MANQENKGLNLNAESVSPLWFAYFPRHVAESKKVNRGCGLTLLSRRQYLSRMDRFQHERSGANFRTRAQRWQSKIAAFFRLLRACFQYSTKRQKCCTKPRPARPVAAATATREIGSRTLSARKSRLKRSARPVKSPATSPGWAIAPNISLTEYSLKNIFSNAMACRVL